MILLPHFTRALVARSFFTWLVLRLAAVGGTVSIGRTLTLEQVSPSILLSPATVVVLLASVTGIGWIYMRRRNEDRFLLSLGFGRLAQVAILLVAPVLAELSILLAHLV